MFTMKAGMLIYINTKHEIQNMKSNEQLCEIRNLQMNVTRQSHSFFPIIKQKPVRHT